MNNNQIQSDDATETKASKPKSFEMYKNEDGKTEITFNLPMKFYTGLDVTEAQARGQIRNDIWLALGVLAENIIAAGHDLLMNDYDNRLAVMAHGESISLLGQYLRGYSNLLDELEVHEKYETKAPEVSENKATEAATAQKTVSETQTSIVAAWLSEQVKSPNEAVSKLAGDLLTELETGETLNSPEYIEMVLKKETEFSEANGEPTEKGENIVDVLCNLASDKKLSDDETSDNLTIVVDQILNPVIKTPEAKLRDLASKISEIMHNTLLPEKIYNAIADEIADSTKTDFHTTDNVLHNLKILRDK